MNGCIPRPGDSPPVKCRSLSFPRVAIHTGAEKAGVLGPHGCRCLGDPGYKLRSPGQRAAASSDCGSSIQIRGHCPIGDLEQNNKAARTKQNTKAEHMCHHEPCSHLLVCCALVLYIYIYIYINIYIYIYIHARPPPPHPKKKKTCRKG